MDFEFINTKPETWQKYYQLRYEAEITKLDELPPKDEFQKMILGFEIWLGKDFLKKRKRNTRNLLINLEPWS